jgi:hypothetical protein
LAGYSRTPLVKKLGIKEGAQIFISGAPKNYLEFLSPLPQGVKILPCITSDIDMIHIFSTNKTHLVKELLTSLHNIKQNGIIWVSWPKKSSKVPTDLSEDILREIALPLGLVDIKVCAVDDIWSGLKLVIRKENRK